MDKNEVLTVIEKYFDDDIFTLVNDYIIEEGTLSFQKDFHSIADEVRLDDIFDVELLSYDEEAINADKIKIFGELNIGIYVSGYQYFDREYHYISSIDEYITMRFSFYEEKKQFSSFDGFCYLLNK